MRNKKTVIILTPGFPKDEQDTTCMPFLQDYLSAFTRLYSDVIVKVIAFQYPFKKGHYKWNGIDIYSAGGRTRPGPFRFLAWRRVWKELTRLKKENNIAVIHSLWLTECSLVGQRFAKRYGVRQVAYAIGQDVLKTNKYLPLLNLDKLHIIAMSQALADKYNIATGKTVQGIIAGGVDTSKMSNTSEEKTIDVIGVGALTPLKNYAAFVEIIAALKKDIPGIKACLIGTGEQENVLKAKAAESGLQNTLQFVGGVSHTEVFSYLNKSKIFLHTSTYEGQSTVMMEALAMGLPIVCFDVGRLHEEGKVFVCKDNNEMIEQIKELLSSDIDYKPGTVRTNEEMARDFMKVYEI